MMEIEHPAKRPNERTRGIPGGSEPLVPGADIPVDCFEELALTPELIEGIREGWRAFAANFGSLDAAGEAIYCAIFEGAPSLQALFTTPRAVQAMRFMSGLDMIVAAVETPEAIKSQAESVGFQHLNLEVTIARVIIFRDAILDLFEAELGDQFTEVSRIGWRLLLNYLGGAIIFVKNNFADRLKILTESWKASNRGNDKHPQEKETADDAATVVGDDNHREEEIPPIRRKTTASLRRRKSYPDRTPKSTAALDLGEDNKKGSKEDPGVAYVPTTYTEMFQFNAAVMGFGNSVWMNEVLHSFDVIVTHVANANRLQEECDFLALRISTVVNGAPVVLDEYKSCMLASLRSLLPKQWDSAHEVAWSWLWENVERLLSKTLGKPPIWKQAILDFYDSQDDAGMFDIRKNMYARFFIAAPAGQDYFKQSNTYLHFVAERMLAIVSDLYLYPHKMADDIAACGLRHVGYGIPTELFGPFVSSCIEVIQGATTDREAVESFRWSIGLVSKMLTRTIIEGSTVVMKAIDTNSAKQLRKAVCKAPRGERALWLLKVQVGTQSISPLHWAVSSGYLEAGQAIIEDLLTIRADRERYYFGVDDLFGQHPDIILILSRDARALLPTLLDKLVWRARSTSNGLRRVNYYVKHLLIDQHGNPSQTLQWLAASKDPKIMAHPVIVLVSDTLWNRIVCRRFIFQKCGFVMSLLVFMLSQAVIPKLELYRQHDYGMRIAVFACRCINYGVCMLRLLYIHGKRFFFAYWEKELSLFFGCITLPSYLKDQYDAASLLLLVILATMCVHEPMLWCAQSESEFPAERCFEAESVEFRYSVFSMVAMALQWFLIVDLAVFSTQLSAFMLVCRHVLSEIGRFLVALVFLLLTFGSAISVLDHDQEEMSSLPKAAVALFAITVKLYQDDYRGIDEPALIFAVFLYQTASAILLLNLLIAQLQCSYEIINQDMIGFARLNRSSVIAETMSSCSKTQWSNFKLGLNFSERLEFNEGDIGISGGIQILEPASMHPIVEDSICRFGGTCSPELPWPAEMNKGSQEEENKFDRMERQLRRAMKQIHDGGHHQGGGGGSGPDEEDPSTASVPHL